MSNGTQTQDAPAVSPLVSPIFTQFSKVAGSFMSINQANTLANGNTVIYVDTIGMLAWPATVSGFTKLVQMTVTPSAAVAGDTPPAAVTFTLSGEGTAALPLFALS